MHMERGLVVASGGIDSITLAYKLETEGKVEELVIANYGQATLPVQKKMVQYHAKVLGLKFKEIKVPLPKNVKRDVWTKPGFKPKKRPITYMFDLGRKSFDDEKAGTKLDDYLFNEFAWIEGRNARIFLEIGTYAMLAGISVMYTGFQFDKHVWDLPKKFLPNGDASTRFVKAMNEVLEHSMSGDIKIVAPFFRNKYDKVQIVDLAKKLGVNLEKTYSCSFYPQCGNCPQCQIVKKLGVTQIP